MSGSRMRRRLIGVSLLPFATAAWAQDTTTPPAAVPVGQPASTPAAGAAPMEEVKDIVVTGSRISRQGFETPTPMTAISSKQLEAKAAVTVTDIVAEIPSLTPNQNVNNSTNVGQTNFNLRGIGANRTLVLLDGLRLEDTSPTGGFNANILPALLINRVEVVTGGASSAYGSDAITGVVNVGLISTMNGGKIDLQGVISDHGDDRQKSASIAFGHDFLSGRLHLVAAGSYFRQPSIIYENARPWGRLGYSLFTNTAANIAAGQPQMIIGPGGTVAQITYGGVITNGPVGFRNTQFLGNGVTAPYNRGDYCGGVSYCQNGDGVKSYDTPAGVLRPKADRYSGYSKLTYDIGDRGHIWGSVLYSYDREIQTNVPNYNNGDLVIRADNVYLPTQIRAQMATLGLTSFTLGRENLEDKSTYNMGKTQYARGIVGADGALPFFDRWKWDAHLAFTRDTFDSTAANNRVQSRFFNVVDAVANPATGGVAGVAVGAPVCRSTLTDPTNGCVPANLFGPGTISAAARAYYLGTSWVHTRMDQLNAGFNVRGDIFHTWAGPISLATGGEYRRDSINQTSDPISQITGWRQASAAPFKGSNYVEEGYVEAVIPLTIPNFAFMRKFEIDTAARVANYESSGTAAVWKVGANYEVDEQVRFRATYSHDFRAPSVNDLYSSPVANNGQTVIDRRPGSTFGVSTTVLTITGGNPDLKPEKSNTFTYGVVLSPNFLPGFRFSVDVYRIKMNNAITAFSNQDVVNNCYAGSTTFCSAITRDPTTDQIVRVQALQFNAQVLKVNGVDFEGRYAVPMEQIGLPGSLVLGSLVSYVAHVKTVANGAVQENAGFLTGTNATPKWRASNTATFDYGPITLRALVTVIGGGGYSALYPTAKQINLYHFDARAYADFTIQYRINRHFEVYGKINNAFNLDPPPIADNGTLKALANTSQYYDSLGRVYGAGIRFRW
ncbi:TonB-dependent receptor plug domain-containing protein [Sphingomonas nostoxanthinifaciens]|uniref:TonB-dependent receptor plug domain-containing protein n=1 Tax=Sphingomonas nostoxanthinifaciens TaxID=2872652 RepID=UPI001CC1EA67|nr:TonB-dependent receptor [Sphingomonas nostoxanthinifaciens]UAK25910.1 TonB-dependent receptor [Sphingomonas nostoxanthinifaciens]